MEKYDIYNSIATRSGGDIYLGVVGPVRTGKSTFISKFIETLVMPNIDNEYARKRTRDELPQSADGKTIMTTEPKFVPNEAISIEVENVQMNVRLIDCVGYLVSGAIGHIENDKPRLVKTPWSKEKMPFDKAAKLGTQKVISEHSTVGVLMTTDGSISDIDRDSYVDAEEKVVKELKETGKPFVIVLNSTKPNSDSVKLLKEGLETKYGVAVIAMNVMDLDLTDINSILEKLLMEFPIVSFDINMPKWMEALPYISAFIQEIIKEIKEIIEETYKIGDYINNKKLFEKSKNFETIENAKVLMSEGKIIFDVVPKPELFYEVLSEQTGIEIENDYHLISYLKQLTHAKSEYDKIKVALDNVKETGYGVVTPKMGEMMLEEPVIIKKGGQYGVRLKASAPSLHIMQVDIETEVNPIVGTEQQSEELVKSLLSEFENDPKSLWETKMFGKSLHMLVNEGLNHKITSMPIEAQKKMRKTLGRIVNEGKGGIICILL